MAYVQLWLLHYMCMGVLEGMHTIASMAYSIKGNSETFNGEEPNKNPKIPRCIEIGYGRVPPTT